MCAYPDVAHIMGEVGASPTLTRNGNTLGEARIPAHTERNRPSWSKAMRVISFVMPPLCGFLFHTPLVDGFARHLFIPHTQQIFGQLISCEVGYLVTPTSSCHRCVASFNHFILHDKEKLK